MTNITITNLDEATEVLAEYSKLHIHNGNLLAAWQMNDIIFLIKNAQEDLEKTEGQLQDAMREIKWQDCREY